MVDGIHTVNHYITITHCLNVADIWCIGALWVCDSSLMIKIVIGSTKQPCICWPQIQISAPIWCLVTEAPKWSSSTSNSYTENGLIVKFSCRLSNLAEMWCASVLWVPKLAS